MSYATLREIAARGFLPEPLTALVQLATLVEMTESYQETIGVEGRYAQQLDARSPHWQTEFRLPWPYVAVEDRASVIILADLHDDAVGLTPRRLFLECATDSEQSKRETLRHFDCS